MPSNTTLSLKLHCKRAQGAERLATEKESQTEQASIEQPAPFTHHAHVMKHFGRLLGILLSNFIRMILEREFAVTASTRAGVVIVTSQVDADAPGSPGAGCNRR